ncbi:MAG TPA: phospholipase D-like domain-containing protein [Burkholderiaceae bacterium]
MTQMRFVQAHAGDCESSGGLPQRLRKFLLRVAAARVCGARVACCAGALFISACASLPERMPASPTAPAATPEQQLVVHDRRGAVSQATERKVLAAVKAEGAPDLTEHHLKALAALGPADFYRGNSTRLLLDGPATFAAMKAAIARARSRVLLESYIVDEGVLAEELALLLSGKVAQGVQVALVYDGVGSMGTDPSYFERLAKAGVAVCKFNPVNPLERPGYWGINHRDHRKVLVVDGDVAFTGGINISRVYSSGSAGRGGSGAGSGGGDALKDGWRDTHIELRGPVVEAFARSFERTWAAQGCSGAPAPTAALAAQTGKATPVAVAAPGQRVVQVLESDPRDKDNRIYTSLLAAVEAAQRSVWLTIAYFAPGDDMIQALSDAARRGVDVALVLPGRSDFTLVLHAGRSYYDDLLAAGVRIYEMDDAVMHAKTAVIDGVVSTVGSSNMDWRSFVANNEINAIVLGRDFGRELEAVFERDLANSRPITLDAWRRRDLSVRVMEQIGRFAERFL